MAKSSFVPGLVRGLILVLLAMSLASCDLSDLGRPTITYHSGNPVRVLESGTWAIPYESNSCQTEPIRIRFSEEGEEMFISYLDSSGISLGTSAYDVAAIDGAVIKVDLRGEDRRDDQDRLVSWDLIVNSEKQFCWRRSDWVATKCTIERIRCPG